jgi:hypothetical protein
MIMLYLVGAPGVGKTTLMGEITKCCGRETVRKPFAHDVLRPDKLRGRGGMVPDAIEMGRRRESFSGTDALSMGVQPKAVDWISTGPAKIVLAEGQRLANAPFLMAARHAGYKVILVHLITDGDTLTARRAQRGSNQAPAWMRAAGTRVDNLVRKMELDVTLATVAADRPPADLARQVLDLDPELEVLRCI